MPRNREVASPSVSSIPARPPDMEEKLRILIVEDEAIVAEDLRQILTSLNYEVVGMALDYDEALSILATEKPDLALIDVQLNDVRDGIQLAEHVKEQYQLPFLFVTSNADQHTVQRARALQPRGYVVKPFEKRELYAAIEMAREGIAPTPAKAPAEDSLLKDVLFVKNQDQFEKVPLKDILFLKADGNYSELHTAKRRFVVRGSVKELMDQLSEEFERIHKSYVINLTYVDRISQDYVFLPGHQLPLGKTYRTSLLSRLKKLR